MLELRLEKNIFFYVFFVIPGIFLIVDLIFTGSGLWSEPFGFSIRKLVFSSVCFYSVVYWLNSGSFNLQELIAILLLFLFIVLWGVVLPLLNSRSISDAISDFQLFFGLIFAPAIYSVLAEKTRWLILKKWLLKFILILSYFHIAIAFVNLINQDYAIVLINIIKRILEPLRTEESTSIFIGYVGENFRVFWGSSIFLLIGFYLSVIKIQENISIKNIFSIITIITAIYLTLTRGMVLSIPIFIITVWLFEWVLRRFRNYSVICIFYGLILMFMTIPIVMLSDPSLLSSFGLGRDISDDLRSEQISSLIDYLLSNLLFGNGFGAATEIIRSESAPWSYEMSVLALFMKIGIAGMFFLLVTFFAFCCTVIFSKIKTTKISESILSRVGALGVIITFCGNTNPYLFSMLGIGLIMFLYFEFRYILASKY